MKITVDANILFSALLREGTTRKLWFHPQFSLFAPHFLLEEFEKYRKELGKRYRGTSAEFEALTRKILAQVRFVQDEELTAFLPAASSLSRDPKGWLYLACALKENTSIWSQDKEMKKQQRVEVKTTEELQGTFGQL